MKAVVLKNPGTENPFEYIENREIPIPEDNEIRIAIKAVGLNPVDYKLADGWGDVDWGNPPVLGLDAAGTVDAVGSRVTEFSVGDRVFYHGNLSKANGAFAEFGCTTAHTASHLPDEIEYATAAALPCAGFTAYQATIEKLKLNETSTILIHAGAGGVGGYAIQLAKLKGAKVFTTCSSRNSSYVKKLGADVVIDYNSENVYERVMKETDGRGVDYVINTIDGETATKDIDLLAFSGQLVAVVELPEFSRLRFYEKGISIHEVALGGAHINGDLKAQLKLAEIGNEYSRLLMDKKITIPHIEKIGIKDIPEALKRLQERHVSGKIVAIL